MSTTDAHANEYLAAIACLHEQTPSPRTFHEGQAVSGTSAGRRWTGHVEWVDGDRVTVNVGGGWVAVNARDID